MRRLAAARTRYRQPRREITIYNFVPEALRNQKIQIAMRWHERLQERSDQHRALADIPVMQALDADEDEGFAMAELAQHLYRDTETSLDLDEVLTFIERSEQFGTSTFFTDLLQIKPADRVRILSIPPGFKSALRVKNGTQLFLLMRYRRRPFAVLFSRTGEIMLDSEQRDPIINRIRCSPTTPPSPDLPADDEFDLWIDRARETWCAQHHFHDDEVQIVCAMALIGSM